MQQIYLDFQWWVVVGGAVFDCVAAREETQPAGCVAASRLCRHLAQTHTPYNASVLSRVSIIISDKSPILKVRGTGEFPAGPDGGIWRARDRI